MRFLLIGLVLVLSSGCAGMPPPSQDLVSNAEYGEPYPQEQAEAKAKELITEFLIDPYSAQYTFSPIAKGWDRSARKWGKKLVFGYALNGTVNAKNRFGGYVGSKPFRLFFHNDKLVAFWFESDDPTLGPMFLQRYGDYEGIKTYP